MSILATPTETDYAEAIQDPLTAFLDAELKGGRIETDPLGLPKSYSGGFAIVFRLTTPDGSRWAIRCFHRLSDDLERRYRAIAQAVRESSSPYLVDVEYLRRGILVRGTPWPIIKMRWVDGQLLSRMLEERRDPPTLATIRRAFETMVLRLQQAGIAHGDLMPDNIVVTKGQSLVLVDYDDMYVPAMASQFEQRGIGNRNFQHPARQNARFDGRLDDFSAMVIWSALLVLERHPDWWERFSSDEKALLFKAADFERPEKSPLLQAIARDSELGWIADQLTTAALSSIDRVPAFASFIERRLAATVSSQPSAPDALATEWQHVESPQLLDLRRDNPGEAIGAFVRVVGEVVDSYQGTTRYGDPYLFVDLGAGDVGKIRLVLWSEALRAVGVGAWTQLTRPGQLVRVSGLVTSYQGRPRIEIDRSSQLTFLTPEQVRQVLGSFWTDPPPPWPRLQNPQVGDRVHHDKFGFGLVQEVYADAVVVGFQDMAREISFEQYFLGLVDRMARSVSPRTAKQPAARSPAKPQPAGRTAERASGHGTRAVDGRRARAEGRPSEPTAPHLLGAAISKSEAERLEMLYGSSSPGGGANGVSARAGADPTSSSGATDRSPPVGLGGSPAGAANFPSPSQVVPATGSTTPRRVLLLTTGVVAPGAAACALALGRFFGVLGGLESSVVALAITALVAVAIIMWRSVK